MATNIKSSELDFEAIRTKLKTYLAAQSEFADYNFEGSGLANILDVLAYNTHINALSANMAINESFLDTAQLRGSVVSHAHSLGYYPKSKTAARATISISANLTTFIGTPPQSITLPIGVRFSASVKGITYTFQTRQTYTATNNGAGIYTFVDDEDSADIIVYEGTDVTRTYYVPDASDTRHYVINDDQLDQDTLSVNVFESTNTEDFTSYSNIKNAIRIRDDSTYYILQETPNGFYELEFTDTGSLGIWPTPGNKIEVNYLRTSGPAANGARVFSPEESVIVSGQSMPLSTTTISYSSQGAEKESIESTRFHAPLTYASQRRMVTPFDYHTLIQSNYPSLGDVTAWGGEQNIPVDYGKMFVSIKYPENTSEESKLTTQAEIKANLTDPLGVASITTEFISPEFLYIGVNTTFDFNPTLTGLTSQATQDRINVKVNEFFTENFGQFGVAFRKSNLSAIIDDISPAILSNKIDIVVNERLVPILNFQKTYTIQFPIALAPADDQNYIIRSSRFNFNNKICTFRNRLSSNSIEIVDVEGNIISQNIGSYDRLTGQVTLTNFVPTAIVGGADYVRVFATPANQSTITPLRNYILLLDTGETSSRAIVNYQTTRVTL